jgi:hypothetical protein
MTLKISSVRGRRRISLLLAASGTGCGSTQLVLEDGREVQGKITGHHAGARAVKFKPHDRRADWLAVDRIEEVRLPGGAAFATGSVLTTLSLGALAVPRARVLYGTPLAIPLVLGLLVGPTLVIGSTASSTDDQMHLERAGWRAGFSWMGHSVRDEGPVMKTCRELATRNERVSRDLSVECVLAEPSPPRGQPSR